MKLNVQRLEWDSDFFGFGVGRLIGPITSATALADALHHATERGIQLIYGQCEHSDVMSHQLCLQLGGRLVDAKRTYSLSLANTQTTDASSAPEADDSPSSCRQLQELAWQSAKFSRYRVDPDMPRDSWQRMYSAWIENSLNGKMADAVIVERKPESEGGRIIGMVTVSHRDEVGNIGLLSVDEDCRGRGIGRRLLQTAASFCRTAGCTQLDVVTQGDNIPACRAYESAGYVLGDEQHIFHFWKKQL